MNTIYEDVIRQPSVLDYDQLGQIVTKNRSFLRDFLLVITGLVVFLILIVFMLLIFNVSRAVVANRQLEQRYLGNYDYTRRTAPPPDPNVNIPAPALIRPSVILPQ